MNGEWHSSDRSTVAGGKPLELTRCRKNLDFIPIARRGQCTPPVRSHSWCLPWPLLRSAEVLTFVSASSGVPLFLLRGPNHLIEHYSVPPTCKCTSIFHHHLLRLSPFLTVNRFRYFPVVPKYLFQSIPFPSTSLASSETSQTFFSVLAQPVLRICRPNMTKLSRPLEIAHI